MTIRRWATVGRVGLFGACSGTSGGEEGGGGGGVVAPLAVLARRGVDYVYGESNGSWEQK